MKPAMYELKLLLVFSVLWSSGAIEIHEGGSACDLDPDYPDELCCGLHYFSPDFGQFCCGGTVVQEQSGCEIVAPAYDINNQVCLYGETIGRHTYCPALNNVRYFCCGGTIANIPVMPCVLDEFAPDEICCGLNVMSMEWNHCCGFITLPYDISFPDPVASDHCKDVPAMDPDHQYCIGGHIFTSDYEPNCPNGKIHYCCGYAIVPKRGALPGTHAPSTSCGGATYDPSSSVCCSDVIYPSNAYMCCNGQVQGKPPIMPKCCGQLAYSYLAHRCEDGHIVSLP